MYNTRLITHIYMYQDTPILFNYVFSMYGFLCLFLAYNDTTA